MPPKGKQATKGQKQIVEENRGTLYYYFYIICAVNGVFISLQYLMFWDSFTIFYWCLLTLCNILYQASYQFMKYMARPRYTESGSLLDGGIDLNMESGLAEHLKDLILLTAIVQTVSLFSNWLWLGLLLAPGRAFYLLWVNILAPWIFAPEQEVDEKKQKKMERKMKRERR